MWFWPTPFGELASGLMPSEGDLEGSVGIPYSTF